jgi:hypothetical protein
MSLGCNVRMARTIGCKKYRNMLSRNVSGMAALLLSSAYGNVCAEEQLRVANADAPKVTAQARVNISVTVVRVMSLRLVSTNSTLAWTNVTRDAVRCTVGDQGAHTVGNLVTCRNYTFGPVPTTHRAPIAPGDASNQPIAIVYTVAGI